MDADAERAAHAVLADGLVGVVQKVVDVGGHVDVGVGGVDAVAVVRVGAPALRLGLVRDLVVMPDVICAIRTGNKKYLEFSCQRIPLVSEVITNVKN